MDRKRMRRVLPFLVVALVMGASSSYLTHAAKPPPKVGVLNASRLMRYVDPLPVPPVAVPAASNTFNLTAQPVWENMLPSNYRFPAQSTTPVQTLTWGFSDGTYAGSPGPTVLATSGTQTVIKWSNALPLGPHLVDAAVDPTLTPEVHTSPPYPPEVIGLGWTRTSIVEHLHGGLQPSLSDGTPSQHFSNGSSKTDYYPNAQPAAPLWYHDHALGTTRLNVYAGLFGGYVLVDPSKPLPLEVPFDYPTKVLAGSTKLDGSTGHMMPLILQDKMFLEDGSLYYPPSPWIPEFFGDAAVVNGKVWPYLNVDPVKYTFVLYNGSEARYFNLKIAAVEDKAALSEVPFWQIATDGGFLPAAVAFPAGTPGLLLGPGERAIIVVDFSSVPGRNFFLTNNAPAPFSGRVRGSAAGIVSLMQFRVGTIPVLPVPPAGAPTAIDPSFNPATELTIKLAAAGNTTRDIILEELLDPKGNPIALKLSGLGYLDQADQIVANSTERWRFINISADAHPMHPHDMQALIVSRTPFDTVGFAAAWQAYKTSLLPGNTPIPPPVVDGFILPGVQQPALNEVGWKDTFNCPPGFITEVVSTFVHTGSFVYHCHILEHEENDMMRRMVVE